MSTNYVATGACLACKSKKRKCDKLLPSCFRCQRGYGKCHYPAESVLGVFGSTERLDNKLSPSDMVNFIYPPESTRSKMACHQCRVAKRHCSRALPGCSRCVRLGIACIDDRILSCFAIDLSPASPLSSQSDSCHWQDLARRSRSSLPINYSEYLLLDPFQTCPSVLGPDRTSQILTYAIKEMWPKLLPGLTHNGVSFTYYWMQHALKSPSLFIAWLHSAAGHMQLRKQLIDSASKPSQKETHEMLLVERELILSLRGFVENSTPDKVSDEIIMSALALALHPRERRRRAALRMKPAPLSNLQWLSLFTDIVISEGHVRGLRYLIHARGGFDKIELPGLKEGLSSYAILVASKHLTRPTWPLPASLRADVITRFLQKFDFESLSENNGYSLFLGGLASALPQTLRWGFFTVRGYSSFLKHYSQGQSSLTDLDMGFVLDLRNKIHYHIMSLPRAVEMFEPAPIYEACRLGIITYSLLILFPVPLMTEPYPRIAELLKLELDMFSSKGLQAWKGLEDLLLWLLVMGGMAALGTVQREWYVRMIGFLLKRVKIGSWEELQHAMRAVVWLNSGPCKSEGLTLWREVQELRQYQSFEEGNALLPQ